MFELPLQKSTKKQRQRRKENARNLTILFNIESFVREFQMCEDHLAMTVQSELHTTVAARGQLYLRL